MGFFSRATPEEKKKRKFRKLVFKIWKNISWYKASDKTFTDEKTVEFLKTYSEILKDVTKGKNP